MRDNVTNRLHFVSDRIDNYKKDSFYTSRNTYDLMRPQKYMIVCVYLISVMIKNTANKLNFLSDMD